MPHGRPFKRIRYLEKITLAGSLCMVYVPCVTSAVTTDFFRSLGATAWHFGLLSGLPMMMVVLQLLGAHWTNRMPRRRPWFMALVITARLVYLPVALLPFVPGIAETALLPILIGLLSLGAGLQYITFPMWLSWMGDLIPRRILNRYWGGRQRYLTLTMAATSLAITAFTYCAHGFPIRPLFLILVLIGCTAGVTDILLFRHIREPPNVITQAHPWDTLRAPLRHRNYRQLVRFLCLFNGVSNFAAAFMVIYTLDVLAVPLWLTALLWCLPSFGHAIVSPFWGRLADRFGHRPVLRLCVWFKPMIVLVFLFVTPAAAVPVLAVALFLDSMLNAGNELAVNGYMLKMAPRANRSMFIAVTSSFSGLAAGAGAILGGLLLRHTADFSLHLAGRDWNHYHLLFAASFVLRLPCIRLAGLIREPNSARARVVLASVFGEWPMRAALLPVSLIRRLRPPP